MGTAAMATVTKAAFYPPRVAYSTADRMDRHGFRFGTGHPRRFTSDFRPATWHQRWCPRRSAQERTRTAPWRGTRASAGGYWVGQGVSYQHCRILQQNEGWQMVKKRLMTVASFLVRALGGGSPMLRGRVWVPLPPSHVPSHVAYKAKATTSFLPMAKAWGCRPVIW